MTTTCTRAATYLPAGIETISQREAFALLGRMELDDALMAAGRLVQDMVRLLGRMLDDKGQFRAVWIEADRVIKVPVTSTGYRAFSGAASNAYEAREAQAGGYEHPRSGERFPITACQVHWHHTGMPIVVMERIDTNPERGDMPEWVNLVDKQQAGWNERTQSWEIYDAGCAPGTSETQWDAIGIAD